MRQLGPERLFTWWMRNSTSGDDVMDRTLEKMLRFLYGERLGDVADAAQRLGARMRESENDIKGARALFCKPHSHNVRSSLESPTRLP